MLIDVGRGIESVQVPSVLGPACCESSDSLPIDASGPATILDMQSSKIVAMPPPCAIIGHPLIALPIHTAATNSLVSAFQNARCTPRPLLPASVWLVIVRVCSPSSFLDSVLCVLMSSSTHPLRSLPSEDSSTGAICDRMNFN